jgi:Fe-S cluster assembly protein SufD
MSGTVTEPVGARESALLDLHKTFLTRGGAPLADLHRRAIERFEALKFPHSKHEMFTFVNTKELVAVPFVLQESGRATAQMVREHTYAGCERSVLVLADGVFRPDLSSVAALGAGVRAVFIEEALGDADLKKYLTETIDNENDVFAALNAAFFNKGLFLDVPDKTRLDVTVQILYINTGGAQPVMTAPRALIRVGAQAEFQCVVKFASGGENYFVNAVQDFILRENCGVTFTQVQEDSPESWNTTKTRVRLDAYARFHAVNAFSGNRLARHHCDVAMKGCGAELDWRGVSVLRQREQSHHYVRVNHDVGACVSRLHFKNIVSGQSRASIDGTVIVSRGAQLTNSDQLINNLMLSDEAHADSKPNLMIFADDVKCTHGSTVGQIDEDQLFYLKTRGLNHAAAKTLLTTSFAAAIVNEIRFPAAAADVRATLLKKLETDHV